MRITEITNGRANNEAEHFQALNQTGFYGKQGAGSVFLSKATGKLGIVHRSNNPPPYHVEQPGTWGTIGGAIESGEDPATAAIHEAMEEVGYHKRPGDYLEVLDTFQSGTFRYTTYLYVVESEFQPVLNWEAQGFGWFDFGNWPAPLHFGLAGTLQKPTCLQRIQAEIQKNQTSMGA